MLGNRTATASVSTGVTSSFRSLIGALVLAAATLGCAGHTTPSSSATTTTDATTTNTATAPALTAEQLRAHLGVGVPAGWAPVDEGNARVFVPGGWTLETKGACIGGTAGGIVSVGGMLNMSCDQVTPIALPAQAIAIIPSTRTHTTRPSLTVHGYRVYAVPSRMPRWKLFDIPQLRIRIATHGTLGPRIVHTLAASGRSVALDPGYAVVPHAWRGVERDGVSLSIPRSWKVVSAHLLCGGPIGSSQLVLIDAKILFAPCPYRIPKAADAAYDAADLYLTAHNPNAPRPTGHAIAHVQHGTTTITVYPEADPTSLDLFVRRAGSPITHVLTVGLGRDGRTAAGVIASIGATT